MSCLRRRFLLGSGGWLLTTRLAFAQGAGNQRFELVPESSRITQRVEVGQVRFRRVGRFWMVQVEFRSTSSSEETFEYRVEWFDEAGFKVRGIEAWQPLTLSPNQQETCQAVGQGAEAWSVRMTLRESNVG